MRGIILSGILFVALISDLHAQSLATTRVPVEQCDLKALQNVQSGNVQSATHIFYLDLVEQSNYQDAQRELSSILDVPGYFFFRGDWNEFKSKRDQYKRQLEYHYNQDYARNYTISTLSEFGLEAYKACLEAISPKTSLVVYLERNIPTSNLVTFHLAFKEELSLASHLLQIVVYGGEFDDSTPPGARVTKTPTRTSIEFANFTSADVPFTFRRVGPSTEFRVVARFPQVGLAANALVIPPTPKVKTIVESLNVVGSVGPVTIEQPAGAPVGKDWGPERHCISPQGGWTFNMNSAGINVTPSDGFCAQKPSAPSSVTEGEICYKPYLSINAGQRCVTSWDIQATQTRTRQVFE